MASERTLGFNPVVLREKFGAGITFRNYQNKEVVFSQGDAADAVFYVLSGTVKLTVVSARHKKAVIAFLRRGIFLEKAVQEGKLCAFTPPDQLVSPTSVDSERGAWFALSSETRSLQRSLMHICFSGLFELRKTWWINSSISAKGDWLGFYCCLGT